MIETLSLQTSLLQTLGWTLLHSLWQGALIAALLFLVTLFMKRSQIRYVVSCTALLLMLLIPVVTFGMLFDKPTPPIQTNVVPDVLPTSQPLDVDTSVNVDTLQNVPGEEQPQGIAPTRTWADERFWWQHHLTNYLPYVVILWLLGVVVLSLRLLLQWVYAERFKRRHTKHASADLQNLVRVLALRLRVSRPVQLLESTLVDAPTVIGLLKPVILLPTRALTGLTVQQLEALLAHELAHIRRHDYLLNILQSVIETLLFYHPAVWWVSRRVRVEREHCCDDVAVRVSGSAVVYAKALERLETLRGQPHLAMAASGVSLVKRIRRLVAKPATRTGFPASWLISFSTLAVLMIGTGFWIYPQLTEAQTTSVSFQVFDRNGEELTEDTAPHAFGMIKKELVDKFGTGILEQNLKVYSTIDLQAQQAGNEASLNAEMPPGAQMVVVGIDPSTGGILAVVGEYLKKGQAAGELNRAVQSYRQLGHSFTPLVYATAFEQAGFTQATILNDEPTSFKQLGQADYKPENHDGTFLGSLTLRKSLNISRNVPAIKLMESVTPEAIATKAQELGYENVQPFWSLALGSNEATPLQHTAAFGSFANGGFYIEPHIINRVEDLAGKVLFETIPLENQVWSEQTAYLTLDLMHGNTVDPGAFSLRAAIDGRYVAGKTGTTNDERDIWFVGMTPGMVATVWIGFDDNSRLPKKIDPELTRVGDGTVNSSRQPIYIWKEFVEAALHGKPTGEFPVPEGIVFKNIDLTTGEEGFTKAAFLVQPSESTLPEVSPSTESSSMNEPGLEQPSALATNKQKLQQLLELSPNLPTSASAYSDYMNEVATLPDEMRQTAIRKLTDALQARASKASIRGEGDGTAINYNGFSLVVTAGDAVAIFDFFEPFDYSRGSSDLKGVLYRYRALEKGGQEQTGEGIVYENYQSSPSDNPDEFNLVTSQGGNMLWVNAGPITFEWSHGTDLGGWVYVDNLNPMLKNKNSFEDFDLENIVVENAGLEQTIPFRLPFDGAEVVTNFGEEGNFVALRASSTEAPVKAVADGVVLTASRLSWNDGYIVSIEHADGLITAYTNLQSKDLPEEGQTIKQGDVIGSLGGGPILPKDVLKLYARSAANVFLDPLELWPPLPSRLESNRIYEHPYLALPEPSLTTEATDSLNSFETTIE
jgi:membrane peptidoglycan carboxypeptidase/beta-lactamase regulating signal transducer with metallopeptidase domain